ncbi:hypothetical protein GQ55_5G165600 [Panicum hallii var. hallii]|uniref:Thioesterase domain-containing protein n=1 Tax=Panicum hallii var. hallii TaxID=1504633 RepID=A0A2T7DH16_9POAL|nr:hypothetical protein GQ55_5G165600 [Panicum hallii var. hallii]
MGKQPNTHLSVRPFPTTRSQPRRQRATSAQLHGDGRPRVSLAEPGRVDAEGRWHAGAIAAAVDNMCSAVVFTVQGAPGTVHYSLSYFSPAHPGVRARAE